jgi:hypothetical protein
MSDPVENYLQRMEQEEEKAGRRELRIEAKQAEILADLRAGCWDNGPVTWTAKDAWEELNDDEHSALSEIISAWYIAKRSGHSLGLIGCHASDEIAAIYDAAMQRLALQLATTAIDEEDDNG